MRVNICSLNSQYIHSSLAPWCLLAGIKKYSRGKYSASVIEGTTNEDFDSVFLRFTQNQPQVIGFCVYIWNVKTVLKLVEKIKADFPETLIVLGGPEAGYNAENLLKNTSADFICSGEGEKQFALLLDAVFFRQNFDIDGVCYRKNEKIIISAPRTETDTPPSPYCDEYFKTLNQRITYFEASRGCPYSCAYCLSGKCGTLRHFDIYQVKSDLIKLAKSGTKTVKFVDRTFNANEKRAKEILLFLIENFAQSGDLCFHFEIAGDILSEQLISIFNSAPKGLFQLEIGMQSFNEQTLEYINRRTNTKKLRENIKKLIAPRNIHIHIDLIAGLPKEDYRSFINSFNIGFSLSPDMLQLGFLKLLHGSAMGEDRERFPLEYNSFPPYEVISTPDISKAELDKLRLTENALDKLYNSGRFRRTVEYLLPFFKDAYSLFYSFGEFLNGYPTQIPLDILNGLIFEFFSAADGVDKTVLRDKMVLDRLATNSSGVIPKQLKIEDKNLKTAKKTANEILPKADFIKRSVAIIYSQQKIAVADYTARDKVTGEYTVNLIDFDTKKA